MVQDIFLQGHSGGGLGHKCLTVNKWELLIQYSCLITGITKRLLYSVYYDIQGARNTHKLFHCKVVGGRTL